MGKRVVLLSLLLLLAACTPDGAPTVTLIADGQTRSLTTEALTVRDLLTEASITLDQDDRVEPAETSFIEDGMSVRVIRVDVETEVEQQSIPFERQTVRDASVLAGETRILEAGIAGVEELTYRIIIEDGVEIERQVLRRVTLQEPRTEVVLMGIQAELQPVPITGTIAYVANRNAWVMQTTSPNQRRLTNEGDLDGHVFALSPDGAYLLYTRVPTETGDGVPINTLWMIETTTANAQPVALAAEGILWAGWAPECEGEPNGFNCRIAYTTAVAAEGSPGWNAENDLWIARPRAGDGRLLSKVRLIDPSAGGTYGRWGTTYAWSPDGRTLAYAHANQVGTVLAFNGAQTPLATFPPYRTYAPWAWTPTVSWSSEGAFIVTTLHGPAPAGGEPEDSPVFDVWAIAVDGTITAELASETGMWAAPLYAPEGDGVAFLRARSPYTSQTSSYDLYVMDRDGSDRRQLFPTPDEIGLEYPEIAWGPGGDRLTVAYQGNLYLIHLSGGDVEQLTVDGGVTAVRWRW